MKIKKKLTRKQFLKQEDEFISTSAQTLKWIKDNYNKLIMGLVFVFILIAVVLSVRYRHKTNLVKSNQFLALAKKTYYTEIQPPPKDPNTQAPPQEFSSTSEKYQRAIELFEQVIKNYPNSDAAEEAEFFIGNCFHYMGKYDDAIGRFNNYIKQYPRGVFIVQAKTGIGYSLKAKGNYKEAADIFQTLLNEDSNLILNDAIYMELGDCFEKIGSIDKAKECYQEVVVKYPESPFLKDAQKRINLLEDKELKG